jgi:hypothetical protein
VTGRVLLRFAAVLALTAALGTAAYGLLELGMKRASSDDRLVADALRVLDVTRGAGAVITVDGRRLVATCKSPRVGTSVVSLDDGTRLLLWHTHVSRLGTGDERELLADEAADLPAAEANLAGSHDLYSRELTATLLAGRVGVRETRLSSRLVYALQLGDGSPLVELFVDRANLRPVGARYVSRTSSGSSEFVPAVPLRRSRPTGC